MGLAEYKAAYKAARTKAYIKFILLAFGLSAVLTALTYGIAYFGYAVFSHLNHLKAVGAGTVLFSVGLIMFFGKKGIIKQLPEAYRSEADKQFNASRSEMLETKNVKLLKGIGILFLAVALGSVIIFSLQTFGLKDNKVRFFDAHTDTVVTRDCADCRLFQLEGEWKNSVVMLYHGTAYGIATTDGRGYDFGIAKVEYEDLLLKTFGKPVVLAETVYDAIDYMTGG